MAFAVNIDIRALDHFTRMSPQIKRQIRDIGKTMNQVNRSAGLSSDSLVKKWRANMQSIHARTVQVMGKIAVAAATAFAISFPIRKAMQFETGMANIAKVVNFDTPEQFNQMGKDILKFSKIAPIAVTGIQEIVEAGGQLGLARKDLLQYAELVTMASVAWDMAPQIAGKAMAKLSNIFEIPINEMEALGDAINVVSNNSAAAAEEIIFALTNKGALAAKSMGLTGNQAVALSGRFIEMGVAGAQVGRIMQGMAAAFTNVGAVGQGVVDAFAADPVKEMTRVFGLLNKIKGPARLQEFINIFGQNFGSRIAGVTENLDGFLRLFGLTADAAGNAGSMTEEYKKKLKTTAAQMVIFKNKTDALWITIGTFLLPTVNEALILFGGWADGLAVLAEEFPETTKWIGRVAAALIAFRIVMLVTSFTGLQLAAVYHTLSAATVAFTAILLHEKGILWALSNTWIANAIGVSFLTAKTKIALVVTRLWSGSMTVMGIKMALASAATRAMAISSGIATAALGAWSAITTIATGIWAVFTAAIIANPIGALITLIVAGITLLIIGAVLLVKHWDKVKAFFLEMWGAMKQVFFDFTDWFIKKLNWLIEKANKLPGIEIDLIETYSQASAPPPPTRAPGQLGATVPIGADYIAAAGASAGNIAVAANNNGSFEGRIDVNLGPGLERGNIETRTSGTGDGFELGTNMAGP